MTRVERFWAKVQKGPQCWEWTGGITGSGYGIFAWREGRRVRNIGAHRYAYQLVTGPIADGLHLDHLCRNTRCVNPEHLEPVTPRVNTRRGIGPSAINARRTRCIRGHLLSGENLWYDAKRNARHCRTCMRARWHKWHAGRASRTGPT